MIERRSFTNTRGPDTTRGTHWTHSAACVGDHDLFDAAMPSQPYGQPVDPGHKSPRTGKPCRRAEGHTGRHAFIWRHLDGRVREVWAADCQVCGRETSDGAVCRQCGAA
jgi:hypothetical protein